MTLTFEDFRPAVSAPFGPRRVTREEILAFAAEFDPQPMHLDEEAAKRSMLGGLSGSGWHLCSIMMRMMFDGFIGRTASWAHPGSTNCAGWRRCGRATISRSTSILRKRGFHAAVPRPAS